MLSFGALYDRVHLSTPKEHTPPEFVHCETLKSRRLNPGIYNTSSSKTSWGGLPVMSLILILVVPIDCAFTIFPLATCTRTLDFFLSVIKSDS